MTDKEASGERARRAHGGEVAGVGRGSHAVGMRVRGGARCGRYSSSVISGAHDGFM